MPYTRVWDNSAPNGAVVDAADIDTVFQQLRVDIVERMNDLIGDVTFGTADPVRFTKIRFSSAVSTLVPGATSFSLRNNADSADNVLITDAGIVTLRNTLAVTTGQTRNVPFSVGNVNSNTSLNLNNSCIQHLTLTGGTPVLTLTNPLSGAVYVIKVLQNGTGGFTYTFAAGTGVIKWPGAVTPTPTTAANKQDIYSFYFDGTDFYGVQSGANY